MRPGNGAARALRGARLVGGHSELEIRGAWKVLEDLAKRKKNKGVIKISEILDDPENKEDEDEKEDEKKLSPQVLEGLSILADLVSISP